MCNPASGVMTESQIYWSKVSDSHEDIVSENNLVAFVGGHRTYVLFEIVPPNSADGRPDYTRPISEWVFKFDEGENVDSFPSWATPRQRPCGTLRRRQRPPPRHRLGPEPASDPSFVGPDAP